MSIRFRHSPQPVFSNRREAGQRLSKRLSAYARCPDVLVLGLPRGGVPVAYEVAQALQAPLDVCLVRKLGVPNHQELAMGAIAVGGVRILNPEVIQQLGISAEAIERVTAMEATELARRDRLFRGDRPPPEIRDRRVILIDDGIATGATLRAAIATLQQQQPQQLIVAVPVAPPETCDQLSQQVDQVICLITPDPLYSIGLWYEDFSQTSDAEVRALLAQAAQDLNKIAS